MNKNKIPFPAWLIIVVLILVGFIVMGALQENSNVPTAPIINSSEDLNTAEHTLDSIDPEADLQTASEIDAELSQF